MKPFFRTLAFVFTSAFALTASAQEAEAPAKPMLWKVEGKELTKPSFLFGTMHISLPRVVTFHPLTARAFETAEHVYTEIPMDIASQVKLTTAVIRTDKKKLSESIGKNLSAQLDAELRAISPSLDATPFQSFKTWSVAATLPILRYQLTGKKALDAVIWDRATAAGKSTAPLEKAEDQMAIFDELSEEEQVTMLADTLRQMKEGRKDGDDPVDELLSAYLKGDADKIVAVMDRQLAETPEGPAKELADRLTKRVLHDRNVTMTKTISDILSSKPTASHFFAVGTAHYVGKDSIVDLLTAEGYRVTRLAE